MVDQSISHGNNNSLNPGNKVFECSYCGYTRILPRSQYNILITKGNMNNWRTYITNCSNCGRQITEVEKIGSDNSNRRDKI